MKTCIVKHRMLMKTVTLLLTASLLLCVTGCKNNGDTSGTKPDEDQTSPTTAGTIELPLEEKMDSIDLGNELAITDIGKYTGIYMEDGSDEVVTNMLMLILKNNNTQDLQLARIELIYEGFTAEFEVTNLPAGEHVVLLEKNRHEFVEDQPRASSAKNVVFFEDSMGLCEDRVKLTGSRGSIQVENLTDLPLGEVYVYYKNSAVDILYGGITYRARVENGLEPGASTNVMTGHYNPDTCTIVNVQILEPVSE